MNLDQAHRQKVAEWIAQGLKLSEIQNRLASELDIHATYMDVRLLVDDLKLTPKDAEPLKTTTTMLQGPGANQPAGRGDLKSPAPPLGNSPKPGAVSLAVDQIARPGAIVSGKVTFSDGKTADWHLDQTGQLGLVPPQPGYRPSAADVQQFQVALDAELSKLGF
jgi:hypothetical protein